MLKELLKQVQDVQKDAFTLEGITGYTETLLRDGEKEAQMEREYGRDEDEGGLNDFIGTCWERE